MATKPQAAAQQVPACSEPASAPALPSHIKLGADWRDFRAGRVFPASVDLLAMLDIEGVPYAAATRRERGIAGFAD